MMTISDSRHRKIHIGFVFVLVVLALSLRFQKFAMREFPYGDEKAQIEFMTHPFFTMLHHSLSSATQFPGDMLLVYPFYKLFGINRWALAFPHILTTVVGFCLLFRLGAQYFKTLWGYVITFLIFGLNQNLIFHAFEIRPYGTLVTLSLASFLIVKKMVQISRPPRIQKIGISLFLFVAILYHFYGGVILFFTYLFHLLSSRENKEPLASVFIRNFKDYGWGLIASLPLWCYFIFGYDKSYLVNYGTFSFVSGDPLSVLKAILGNLLGFNKFYFLLAGFFAFLIPQRERLKQLSFFIFLVVLPVSFVLVSCILSNYYFVQRLFVWVMPFFAFLLGWQWDSFIYWMQEKCSLEPQPA